MSKQYSDQYFFKQDSFAREDVHKHALQALNGLDDGELFIEYRQNEQMVFDDNKLKTSSFQTMQGFGLRGIADECTAYAHSSLLSVDSLRQAAQTIQAVKAGASGITEITAPLSPRKLYSDANPILSRYYQSKLALLKNIDAYSRGKDSRICQVSASLMGEWQLVHILRKDGFMVEDVRPLVRLNVSMYLEQNGRMEQSYIGSGGRYDYDKLFDETYWKSQVDEAYRKVLVAMESIPAPAGEMPVVLGPGWPGILLHEAIGHGLEGDFNRKKLSAFSDLMGKQVAAKGITIVDDGTMPDRRGSLNIDDEGTPSERTILIDDGILTGYMQDRLNARLMGVKPTGNGRRESYAHCPMPRMTNTYMLGGQHDPQEMIASVKKGIYAVNFGGGQVDITSGKFVFSASEAYLIENGKVTAPIKGATLIGNGPDSLKTVTMIGNDMELDLGVGTCGKDGQNVPVGVGQPSLLLSSMTVGGTEG